jgi:hypothetical protein
VKEEVAKMKVYPDKCHGISKSLAKTHGGRAWATVILFSRYTRR